MKTGILRSLTGGVLVILAGPCLAYGLGELRRSPALGDAIQLEIELITAGKEVPSANCFALTAPAAAPGAMAWVKSAQLSVRSSQPAVLEIRGAQNLREPIMRFGVELGCGSHVTREYTVLASPRKNPKALDTEDDVRPSFLRLGESSGDGQRAPSTGSRKAAPKPKAEAPMQEVPVAVPPAASSPAVEKPLETVAPSAVVPSPVEPTPAAAPEPVAAPVVPAAPPAVPEPVAVPDSPDWTLYVALLLGVGGLLGFLVYRRRQTGQEDLAGGSLPVPGSYARPEKPIDDEGDRQAFTLQEMTSFPDELKPKVATTAPSVSPKPAPEPQAVVAPEPKPEPVAVKALEPLAMPENAFETKAPVPEVPALEFPPLEEAGASPVQPVEADKSVAPVMELAEIMLSFGRVKGAAQALQEFVDNNPSGALQPWIRLLDVYRLAGMRDQFEAVARNLNQTFNVELMGWDEMEQAAQARDASVPAGNLIEFTLGDAPAQPASAAPTTIRPQSVEDMPRIMQELTARWADDAVIEWIYSLLRDNRGGTRLGFARPVVEELLFLIELCEYRRQLRA